MFSLRTIAVLSAAVLVAVGILAVYLFLELGRSNDLLADTRATLTETKTTLGDTRATLQETNNALAAQRSTNSDQEQAKALIESYNATLTANLDDALDAIDEWTVAYADKEAGLSAANAELTQTKTELARSSSRVDELTSNYAALQTVHTSLVSTEASLRQDYDGLVEQYGDVERLQNAANSLREEIAELEAKRRPLILSVGTRGFACTGSMEPKITCMDEATYLENPRPEEITVGATIYFNPSCWEDEGDPDNRGAVHRVMDIKVENGTYFYWPQGDANEVPDDCWVPFDHVQGYIVEIHKDVQPENAKLRDSVNNASKKEAEARAALRAARERLDELEVAYLAIIERYCGAGVSPSNCRLPSPEYEIATRAYRAYDSAYGDYEYALEVWEGSRDYHECWQDSALTAIHFTDGSPPLYRICVPPIPPFRGR